MSTMRALSLSTALLLAALSAQAEETPVPTASRYAVQGIDRIEAFVAAPLDLEAIDAEDEERDRRGLPPRFAVAEPVAMTPRTHGTWERLPDGRMLWRLRIIGHGGTTSLNLGFRRFRMPPGGRLLLYSTDGQRLMRPFTAADNETHGELWTPVLLTGDLVAEVTVPAHEADAVELELSSVNQGYRGFGTGAFDKSGSCNLDIACLDPDDTWREEMRAVAKITIGGTSLCTGSLLNNTAANRRMLFITAEHCKISSGNAATVVAYWNYQNSFCRPPGSAASGAGGDGSHAQVHSGSFFRAGFGPSDMTLIELDDPPVTAYRHYWAGWDRSPGDFACTAGSPCVALHHPRGHEKRITYSTTSTATTSYGGQTSPGNGTHIWAKWAADPPGPYTVPGVTEGGSSGSPLYSAAGRFIGQLHGGASVCGATGNNLSDYYGRFSVSWTGGGTSGTRLSNWLDPGNTGATALPGLDTACGPPATGIWNVTEDCTISTNAQAAADVVVFPGVLLTITATGSLDMNLAAHRLVVRHTGGVLIQKGGKIF